MPTKTWNQPVELDLTGKGVYTTVGGPRQALSVLQHDWPLPFGMNYQFAKSKCHGSIAGEDSLEVSRQALLAAARDVGIRTRH